jgi:outer membrane protein
MRLIALLLSTALLLPAQDYVKAMADPVLADNYAPWFGGKAYWKKVFATPDIHVTLQAPVKLRDFIVNDKLELSLKSYLELVMANNTDIAIQRVQLETPQNAIQRAFGVFDPFLNTSFNSTRATTPSQNTLEGAVVVSQLNQPFAFSFRETFASGIQITSSLNWNKISTNSTYQVVNPGYSNTWQMGFSQPLLRNRGRYVNKLPITIARAQLRATQLLTEDSVQRLLVGAENAYWDVIAARERITVQEQALELARQSLERAKKEIELGATSPLEIYQPEQQFATAQIGLTQVQFQLIQAEDVLRRQIGIDLDPTLRKLPIVLTEKVEPTLDEKPFDNAALVDLALSKRADLQSQKQDIVVADLQIDSSRNNLKPLMNVTGSYLTYGSGGPIFANGNLVRPGGPGGAWGQMFDFSYPTYVGGVTLNFPLRDRVASANMADSMTNKKLQVFQVRQAEQQVRQDVLNAITQVENSRASVKLAKIAVDYSIKRAEADQKRYDLGVITLFFLLSSQTDLTNAQSNLVNTTVQYRRNLLNLQQRLGTLFEEKGIVFKY